MKKWVLITVVVLIAVLALAPAAFAQGPFNDDNSGFSRGSMMRTGFGSGNWQRMGNAADPAFGTGPRWGGETGSLITVAAEQLGLTPAELVTELQAGKTIAQVAGEKGIAVETIVEASVALRVERLAELVTNGQLTQEQVDAMLAVMRANVTARLSEAWTPGSSGQGAGPGNADQDGDGVCDHLGTGGQPGRGGRGGRMMGR